METIKNLWMNFWGWVAPGLKKLLSDVSAELIRIALEEVKNAMQSRAAGGLSDEETRKLAATAIRSQMAALGMSVKDQMINEAIETALGKLKG